jgi:glycosyltransferase involved in cell wall biosynthesis
MKLIASSPSLELSGANVLLAGLFHGFATNGHCAKWLITGHEGSSDRAWLKGMAFDFQDLPPTPLTAVVERQRLLIGAVQELSPCVYLPNYDFDMLWAVGALPDDCRTVLIMHCDDPVYYEAIRSRGSAVDAIVCVSAYLAEEVKRRWPGLAGRVHHIPFGVVSPDDGMIRKPSLADGPLEVVYCGRLAQEQKRIGDLAEIILTCHSRKLPARFHIAGSGPEQDTFFYRLRRPLDEGYVVRLGQIPHDQVGLLLGRSHVFILTSAYEGLPVSLLEAMAHGCVPVVTAVESGVPEAIDEGVNGFMLPIGDTDRFVQRLENLCNNEIVLNACSIASREAIANKGYTFGACLDRYLDLFLKLLNSDRVFNRAGDERRILTPPRYRWHRRIRARLGW